MNTELKTCFKCGVSKPRCEFYRHPQMGDGLLGKCKACTKLDVGIRYWIKRPEIQAYDRARSSLPHRLEARKQYARTQMGRVAHARARRAWEQQFPEKIAAVRAVHRALRSGNLVRTPCEVCGEVRTEAHHDDYSKPLDVRWLCVRHHKEHHKALRAKHRESCV